MACKVFVNYTGPLPSGEADRVCKRVADALGICCEDVIFLPDTTLTVVDVPGDLTAKRDKLDKEAEKEAKKAEKAAEPVVAEVTALPEPSRHHSRHKAE